VIFFSFSISKCCLWVIYRHVNVHEPSFRVVSRVN